MNTKHLKAKILDLAIRGKLVPQDPSEGNAADLLNKIREEKSILIEQKKIKADKNSSFIIKAEDGRHYEQFADGTLKDIEDDIPFELPESWCWCRFKDLFKIINGDRGKNYPAKSTLSHSGIPFISALNLKNNTVYKDNDLFCLSEMQYNKLGSGKLEKNDMVLCIRGSIGKHGIFPFEKGAIASSLVIIREYSIDKRFSKLLDYYFKSPLFFDEIKRFDNGTAQPNLAAESLCLFYFPLPPLSEQQRIVSAIERAFEQIDIIEKNKLNLKTYIKQTKSKVLDLAIHGKLVEQNPGEGNAFELLEKIRKEKSDLIKQKKLKEDKKSSFIIKAEDGKHYEQFADGTLKDIADEIPFEEPKGWTWCRINEIAVDMADGPFGSNLKSEHYTTNKEARIIQLSNLSDEGWREENTRYTTIKHATENISRSIVEPGNIVIAKMMPAGRAMICPDKEQMYVLSSDCVKLVPIEVVYKQFLLRALNSPFFRNRVVDNVQGVTRQRTSISKLRSCYFPLPPFEEQKRIVDKLEQVFQQLDILEKSLGE